MRAKWNHGVLWGAAALAVATMASPPARSQPPTAEAESPIPQASRTASELLELGDQAAEEKKYDEAILHYKDAYEQLVPKVRQRAFEHPVTPRLMRRSEIRDYMLKELGTEVTPEELKLMDRSLKAFGLVPLTLDVKEIMVNLMTEEVGGFYNPRSKEMFLIREDPRKRGFLSSLFGRPEFNAEEQRTTLAHEMTHALADQHFDLVGLDKAVSGNDDMATAVSGLVEGEATLVMMAEMGDNGTNDRTGRLSPEEVDMMFNVMATMMPLLGGRTMRTAPPIFRETLIFPYHKGTVFVAALTQHGGWTAIDEAFMKPPASTEQILHPEKYFMERDDPTAIELPAFEELLSGSGWTSIGQNSLGELQIGILLDKMPESTRASEGWDGDHYMVLEHADGRLGLAWYTTWDSSDDARQFAATASQWFVTKGAKSATTADHEATIERVFGMWTESLDMSRLERTYGDRSLLLEIHDRDVVIVDGLPTELTTRIGEKMWECQKAPLTIVRSLAKPPASEQTDPGKSVK